MRWLGLNKAWECKCMDQELKWGTIPLDQQYRITVKLRSEEGTSWRNMNDVVVAHCMDTIYVVHPYKFI